MDTSPWVLSEGLNGIYDCFAEPEVNAIFVQLDMMKHLQALVPKITANLASAAGRALPEHVFGRLDEANDNLQPFIEYKRPQFA